MSKEHILDTIVYQMCTATSRQASPRRRRGRKRRRSRAVRSTDGNNPCCFTRGRSEVVWHVGRGSTFAKVLSAQVNAVANAQPQPTYQTATKLQFVISRQPYLAGSRGCGAGGNRSGRLGRARGAAACDRRRLGFGDLNFAKSAPPTAKPAGKRVGAELPTNFSGGLGGGGGRHSLPSLARMGLCAVCSEVNRPEVMERNPKINIFLDKF